MKKCFLVLLALIPIACSTESVITPKTTDPPPYTEPVIVSEKKPSACPDDMVEINGNYCPNVQQTCLKWMEDPKLFPRARCLEFEKSVCLSDKVPMHFCIDKEEFASNHEGKPVSDISWTQAKKLCESDNKRLCHEEEWTFSCEGEEIVPYSTGYVRPSSICNMDITTDTVCGKDLCDHRKDISECPDCISPFGIHNMSGNVDEWVEVPIYSHSKVHGLTMRSGLKGGHWLPVRNRCRPITKDHDEYYHQVSIGFRCCKDI